MHFCCDKIPDLRGLGTCHPLIEVIIQPQTHLAERKVTKCTLFHLKSVFRHIFPVLYFICRPRIHCVGGCWDQTVAIWHRLSDALTTRLDLIHLTSEGLVFQLLQPKGERTLIRHSKKIYVNLKQTSWCLVSLALFKSSRFLKNRV